MAEDRLQDLLGGTTGALGSEAAVEPDAAVVKSGLAEYQEVKAILDKVGLSITGLRQAYVALPKALTGKGDLEARLAAHTDDAKGGLAQAVAKLGATKAALDAEKATLDHSGQQKPASHRMRHNGWLANSAHLFKLVIRLMEVQEGGAKQRNVDARRQYLIVRPDATEEQIEQALAAGAETFAQTQASTEKAAGGISMAECQLELESWRAQQLLESIRELQELYVTLATIVDQIDDHLQSIEADVQDADHDVKGAIEYLIEANKQAKAARKKKACASLGALCLPHERFLVDVSGAVSARLQ
jgi:hypothetical protein